MSVDISLFTLYVCVYMTVTYVYNLVCTHAPLASQGHTFLREVWLVQIIYTKGLHFSAFH